MGADVAIEPIPGVLDEIRIKGLHAECGIGFSPHETTIQQPVDIGLILSVRPPANGYTDDLAEIVDYKILKNRLLDTIGTLRFKTLEALSEWVAKLCLHEPGVVMVEVTCHKPGALTGADDVAVRVLRRESQ